MFQQVTAGHNTFLPKDESPLQAKRIEDLAASVVLVLGSPRSGTTWLAKIFDSHPAVLYRHEPDELAGLGDAMDPLAQIQMWLREKGLRAARKRPAFPKVWRPAVLEHGRDILAAGLAAAQRLGMLSGTRLPDLIPSGRWAQAQAVMKLVNWDGSDAVRRLPACRCIFILRHPCGQIASVMAGLSRGRFGAADQEGGAVDFAAAAAFASQSGVDAASFRPLPLAAQLAWVWLAFNEPAVAALRDPLNARIILYEDLCQDPETNARALFSFAGLDWHPQTAAFLGRSTNSERPSGYYGVFRNTHQVAERWRTTLSPEDQAVIQQVVSRSPLASYWTGLA